MMDDNRRVKMMNNIGRSYHDVDLIYAICNMLPFLRQSVSSQIRRPVLFFTLRKEFFDKYLMCHNHRYLSSLLSYVYKSTLFILNILNKHTVFLKSIERLTCHNHRYYHGYFRMCKPTVLISLASCYGYFRTCISLPF